MTSNDPGRGDDRHPDEPTTADHTPGPNDAAPAPRQEPEQRRGDEPPWQGRGPGQTPAAPWQGQNPLPGQAPTPWQGQDPTYGQYGRPPATGEYGQYGTQPQDRGPGQPGYGQQPPYGQAPQYGQQSGQPQYGGSPQYGQPPQYVQPQSGQPEYGQYGAQPQSGEQGQQPPYGQPPQYGQYGAGAPQYSAPYGFGGAPQPGIIPLRPLNVGEILDGGFRAIRANPKVMFGLSLLVMGILTLIEAVALSASLDQVLPLLSGEATPEALEAVGASGLLGYTFSSLAVSLASVVLTGLLIISVSQSVIGRVITAKELWTYAKGQIWRLIGLTLLMALLGIVAVVVISLVVALMVATAVASASEAGAAAAGLGVLLLVLVAIVLVVFVSVRLGLAAPALMLERAGVMTSIRRSWALTSGHFWRIFGALALAVIIVTVLSSVLTIPVSVLAAFLGPDAAVASVIVTFVLSALISALTTPFLSAVLALVYVDVRMRKEGLDVELARAAEAG